MDHVCIKVQTEKDTWGICMESLNDYLGIKTLSYIILKDLINIQLGVQQDEI